jgi:hypothetical protein
MNDADRRGRLVRAWLLVGVVDFLFASCLSVFAYRSTFSRLWQGVASVLLGSQAMNGGSRTVAIGVLMHFGVALFWAAVFVFLVLRSSWVQSVLSSRYGVVEVAALYGPLIWMLMSLLVIPAFTRRPPTLGFRWWVQLFAHIPFVALPIVWAGRPRSAATA